MTVFLSSLRRLRHLAGVLFRHALAHALGARLERWPRLQRRLPAGDLSRPERLRAVIEDLGGTFIKFGQMLALQPDILSLEYCNALYNLLDRVTPFEYREVERIFIEELGRAPTQIFDTFERTPVATASIGQVHVAYLDGRKFAVKAQRPNVERDFMGDVRLMKAAVWLIRKLRLRPLYWMIEPTSEFIDWTREELDYRCEARYLEQLRSNARNNTHEYVPEVLRQFTTRRTLVTEFLNGVTALAYLRAAESGDELTLRRLKAMGFDPDQFALNIISNFLSDAFQHGMFHADLHPANLMIMPGNVVGYIDFGITALLSRYSRQNLIALTMALVRADLDGMCQPFFNVSTMEPGKDRSAFRTELKRMEREWYEIEGKERRMRVSITKVMLDMLHLSRRTGVWPERDVVKYVRSSIAADGLITRLAPGFDLGRRLEQLCHQYITWQARRELFSYDRVVDWSGASGRLMRDGLLRAASLLQQIATGEWAARIKID
jgi:ubiquinone biosynthesis protein